MSSANPAHSRMPEPEEPHGTSVPMPHHHVNYLMIFFTLVILTVVTVAVAFVHLGSLNFPVALAIAITKATLVILFFMHVKYSTKLTKLTVGAGVFTFLVLVGMTLSDYWTRAWGRW